MDIATISILVIIIGCVIGLAEWVRLVKADAGAMAARIQSFETRMERAENEINDCKYNKELIESSIQKIAEQQIINDKALILIQEALKII